MQPRWPVVASLLIAVSATVLADDQRDPFAFFQPSVKLVDRDRVRLAKDDVIVQMLPADDGHVATFAATRLNAPPDVLLQWTRAITSFRQGAQVVAVGRFSEAMADSDLAALTLDDDELNTLRKCRVGSCDMKLTALEVAEVQKAVRAAGNDWREAAQRSFRRILIGRVRLHRERGLLAVAPFADRSRRMSVGEAFSAIVARSPYLARALPDVVNQLLAPAQNPAPFDSSVGPARGASADESFYYWSHDRYGAGKPVVTVTYVRLLRRHDPGVPRALTISTQIFANHYIEGALALTAVSCDEAGATCYLAYLNRTQVDFLGGVFGRFKRSAIEGRIESETPNLLRDVRERLESGPPPTVPAS